MFNRTYDTLPSNTETNPREYVLAVDAKNYVVIETSSIKSSALFSSICAAYSIPSKTLKAAKIGTCSGHHNKKWSSHVENNYKEERDQQEPGTYHE